MKKVLVIGDAIADVYRTLEYRKQAPDNGMMPVYVETSSTTKPGGALNVAVNIASLAAGIQVDVIAVVDSSLAFITNKLAGGVCSFLAPMGIPMRKERTEFTGALGSSIKRLDNKSKVSSAEAAAIHHTLVQYLASNKPDLIVLSDYAGGTVSEKALNLLLKLAPCIMIDTKETDMSKFSSGDQPSFLIKLNDVEWKKVLATNVNPEYNFNNVIITHGENGATLLVTETSQGSRKVHTFKIPSQKTDVVDVCGCGDTFMAGLVASLLNCADVFTAMQFANAAASTVVSQQGTAVADLQKTLELVGRDQ